MYTTNIIIEYAFNLSWLKVLYPHRMIARGHQVDCASEMKLCKYITKLSTSAVISSPLSFSILDRPPISSYEGCPLG